MTSTMRITIVLAALVALVPRPASAQIDPLTNAGACVVTGFAAGATTIAVNTGCGATLPASAFNASVCQTTDYPVNCRSTAGVLDPNYEVVRVTAGFGTDSLTITRAQEGTSDAAHNTAAKVYWLSTFTAKTVNDLGSLVNGLLDDSIVLAVAAGTDLTDYRVLEGTANQITVTDGGAGNELTLSTPQDIHTAATPTFATMTLAEPVGASALTLTGATQTASFPVINAAQIWNNAAVVFTGIKLNVTNTASSTASNIIDLQVDSATQFRVTRGGTGVFGNSVLVGSGVALSYYEAGIQTGGSIAIGTNASTRDTYLWRDAAHVFAQRSTTNPQAFRLYNTWTDASNYERLGFTWATNVARIGTANAGTGTARVLTLDYGGTTTAAISIPITSGDITLGGSVFPTGYKSADGTAGLTQTCTTTVTAITIKNGLVTAVTCP